MNHRHLIRVLSGIVAICAGVSANAASSGPVTMKFSGFIEGYYGYNFNKPSNNLTFPRQFDYKDNLARINNATVHGEFTFAGLSDLKLKTTFWLGDNADIFYDGDTAKEPWARNFRQFYLSYSTAGDVPITIDFGKFDTWIGYEVTDSVDNINSSRGVIYTLGIPAYHSGIRATAKLTDKFELGVAAVQGWNESANGDKENSYGVWFKSSLDSKTNAVLSYYTGKEGNDTKTNGLGSFGGIAFGTAGLTNLHLINFNGSRTVSDKLSLGWDSVYASAVDGPNSGKWSGVAFFANMTLDEKRTVAGRFEMFDDADGLRTGTASRISSFTGTYSYKVNPNLRVRGEVRRDWSDKPVFVSDTGVRKFQLTGLLAAEYKF